MVLVSGNGNLLVRSVGCAGINDTFIVPGDDAFGSVPPIHPAATATVMMMVVVVAVGLRRADIIICTTDVYKCNIWIAYHAHHPSFCHRENP